MKMCLLQVRLRILYRVSIPGIVRTICSFPPILSQLVPTAGLEPARLSTLHSECSTSAYSVTRAYFGKAENILSQQFATRIENFSLAIRYQGLWPALLVGIVGLEPTRYHYHRILSPTRLPIPPYPQIKRILGSAAPSAASLVVSIGRTDWIILSILAPDTGPLISSGESLPMCFWLTHNLLISLRIIFNADFRRQTQEKPW